MIVDFADRMTVAILHKNYHTLFVMILRILRPTTAYDNVMRHSLLQQQDTFNVINTLKSLVS